MKNSYTLPLSLLLALLLTSCNDNEGSNLSSNILSPLNNWEFNEEGISPLTYSSDPLIIDNFVWSHYLSDWGTVEGFTPANSTTNSLRTPLYDFPYDVIPARSAEDTPYMVAYWSSFSENSAGQHSLIIRRQDNSSFAAENITVTNTCYSYYTMLYGDDYCKKFEKGDWLKIIAHGVKADGNETTLDIYLAQCTSDDAAAGILNTWHTASLSSLGEITALYFTMESSDSGEWGMNTPAYFAVKELDIKF